MFAILEFERNPLQWGDLPAGLFHWLQSAGGFALLATVLWVLVGLPRLRPQEWARIPKWQSPFFRICVGLAGVLLLLGLGIYAFNPTQGSSLSQVSVWAFTIAGLLAVLGALTGFLGDLTRFRYDRVYALAKLSFKEALRRRILYAFSALLLVFLFGSWFIDTKKPADEVRTYIEIVFIAMMALLLVTAALVASLSIPADIKQQTIHTIVTKPVERFEIILGRFFGFLALMTLVLLVMTTVSMVYVLRGVNPEAAAESLKARVALYGDLTFENTGQKDNKGINVGREWDYRSHITRVARDLPQPTACWSFFTLPGILANRPQVRLEFYFDIYRTTKGQEGRGVECDFIITTWRYRPGNDQAYRKAVEKDPSRFRELAEELGYFEVLALPVRDYSTQELEIPGGIFKNALANDTDRANELRSLGRTNYPLLQIRVRMAKDTPQYVGMARHDLYLRQDRTAGPGTPMESTAEMRARLAEERSGDQLLFCLNFYKAAFGIWLQMALVIGLGVTLSTTLNGVISFMIAVALYMGGWCRDFIYSVASGTNYGGGPLEAAVRIANRELASVPLSESSSTSAKIITAWDAGFRWTVRRILDIIPDVDRFHYTPALEEGFNISSAEMTLSFLMLVGYLFPWFILAYYLLKWREVAGPT